jgi:hypothetical protein
MNKLKSVFNVLVRLTSMLLTLLAVFLLFIFVIKIVCWIETDHPISRGSMLILGSLSACLLIRNQLTFVLLVFIAIGCIVYQFANFYISGYTFVDFTASFQGWYDSMPKILRALPTITYFSVLFLSILPFTWKLYFSRTKELNDLLDIETK